MGLEDVGVVFISKGFQNFISNLGKANRSITDFGNMTQNKLRALKTLNDTAVILSNDLKKVQTSADRVTISQQRTAQSANYLKTAQEKVKISANNATSSYNKWQKSINDASAAASRASVSIQRLQAIDRLNQALISGAVNLDQYTTAALATNNQLRQLDNTASSTADTILNITQSIGSGLGSIGGVFGSVAKWGNIGGIIGGALGTIIPGVGNVIGAITGYIMGALGGLGAGIIKWFIGLAASIGRSIINLGKQILGWIGGIFKSIIGTIKGFLGTIFNLLTGGIFQSGWNNLGNTIVSSMFKFEILKEAIRKVVTEINQLAGSAYEAAGNLQMYTARLNFLIASQVRFSDVTIDSAKAMEIAASETQNLLRWEQKLALTSPVSIEDVNTTLSMGIAMGWNVKAAQNLTSSILNYTSAVGLGSEISERIIYNFAQMKNAGKVTGTELRDLARGAFIPVNKVLEIMYQDLQNSTDAQKKYTGSFQQFREEAAAGKVDVEGFFDAFNKYVGTYMPDAMEKMNYTIVAVKDNIRDLFKTLLGWNIVGPIVKQFTEPLKRLVDTLSSDKVILGAQRIGQGVSLLVQGMKAGIGAIVKSIGDLLKAAGFALPTVKNIVQALVKFGMAFAEIGKGIAGLITRLLTPVAQNINTRFGSTFNSMRGNFFKWGANLILSLAKGMMQAASKVLVAVMRAITKLLTSWLVGHSPPKVAPDIDKWGAKTIEEYYGGFANPDPAVVNKAMSNVSDTAKDIADSASKAVSKASASVAMPDFESISGWLHTFSQADFEALDSVQASLQDVLGVMTSLGQISDQQSGQMFADISTNLMQAFSEFNKTGKMSVGIFDQLRNLGGALGTELAELLDVQLQLAVAIEDTTKAQKAYDEAVKASARAETKVNKMLREYNNILRKGASKSFLRNQLKIVNASEKEYGLAKKTEGERKTELDLAEERQKALEESVKLQEQIIKQMTELVKAQKDAAGGMASEIENALAELGNIDLGFEVTPPWTDEDLNSWIKEAQSQFTAEWENIKKGWADTWKSSFGLGSPFSDAMDDLKFVFGGAVANLKTIWDDFANSVGLPGIDKILAIWNQPLQKTVTSYGRLPQNAPPGAELNPETGNYEVTTYTNTFTQKFLETIKAFQTSIQEHGGITTVLGNIAGYILGKIADFLQSMASDPTIQQKLSSAINSVLDFIGNAISSPTNIAPGYNVALEYLGTNLPSPAPLSRITSSLIKLLTDSVTTAVNTIIANGTLQEIGAQIGTGLWNGIKSMLFPKNWFRDALLTASAPGVTNENIVTNVQGLGNLWDTVKGWFTPSEDQKNKAKGWLEPLGTNLADGIGEGIIKQIPLIDYSKIVAPTQSALDTAFDAKSPAKTMFPVGANLADGVAKGMEDQIESMKWETYLQPLIDKVNEFYGITANGPSEKFSKTGSSIIAGMADGIDWAVDIAVIEGGEIYNSFDQILDSVTDQYGLNNLATSPFYTMGVDMVQGIINGFESMIPVLIAAWNTDVVDRLPDEMRGKYYMDSPSKLFMGMGQDIVAGLALGLKGMSTVVETYTMQSLNRLTPTVPVNATMQAPPVFAGSTVNWSGDTYINNNMDWAMFKEKVHRAIVER